MSENDSISTIEATSKPKGPRGERKARKLLIQNNQKPIENVSRVVLRQNDGTLYVIDAPEVFRHGKTDTFLVFGKVIVPDTNLSEMQAAKAAMDINEAIAARSNEVMTQTVKDEDEDDNLEVDESGLNPLDIELVMSQANVSRQKAVRALLKNENDLVNAIMDLSQ